MIGSPNTVHQDQGAAMKKRAVEKVRKQECVSPSTSFALQQLALPMMIASEAIKKGLLAFVQQMGMLAFSEMLEAEAAEIAGPKGRHAEERTHHHWGTTRTMLPFGGRHVVVERPRVRGRGKGGKEGELGGGRTASRSICRAGRQQGARTRCHRTSPSRSPWGSRPEATGGVLSRWTRAWSRAA